MSNRGSEWHKWDLHLHTPSSYDYEVKSITDQSIIDKLEGENISVVAISDHHIIDLSRIKNLQKLGRQKQITVLPAIEFLSDARGSQPIHFLGIFHEDSDIDYIWGQIENVSAIKNIKGQNKSPDGVYCDLKETIDLIHELGGLVSIHAGSKTNSVEKITHSLPQSEAQKIDIVEMIDFFELGKLDDKKNYEEKVFPSIKKYVPMIICSDNHNIIDYQLRENCWIKALPTFDGLIQTLFNPIERIRFQNGNPIEIKSEGMLIDKITYGEDNKKEILFSYDLSSIIGKRGSGKSILLKAIASKVDEDDYTKKVGAEKAKSDKKWRDKHFANLKVIWKDGAENAGTDKNPKKVFYLPQGYLSSLAYDENAKEDERYDFLISLLRKNDEFSNAEKQAKDFVDNNGLSINFNINQIFIDFDNIRRLEDENKSIGSADSIEVELKTIVSRSKEISEKYKISNADKTNYQKASNDKKTLTSQIKIVNQDITILNKISNDTKAVQIDDYALNGLSYKIKQTLSDKLEESGQKTLKQAVNEQMEILSAEKTKFEDKLTAAEQVLEKLTPRFVQQKELDDLLKKESELKSNKVKIEQNQKSITETIAHKNALLDDVKNKYFSYKKEQENYFGTINFDNFEFIRIKIQIKKSIKQFEQFVSENINTTRHQGLDPKTISFITNEKHELTEDNFESIFNDLMTGKVTLLKAVKDRKQSILELLRNPYNIEFLDSIMLNDDDETLFRNMTGGQKAISMLELIFKFDKNKYPILLDQPEDDLDTSGVANNIVKFIQRQKEDRQIFVVSHNGSLVVCSDSEEIIVAENKDGGFQYKSGAIEEEDVQSKIIDILEGGEDALKLRMNKLRIEQ